MMSGNDSGTERPVSRGPSIVTILFLFVALFTLLVFGQFLSTTLFLLVAFFGWSRPFEENRAKGKPTFSETGRAVTGTLTAILGLFVCAVSYSLNHSAPVSVDRFSTPLSAEKGTVCGEGGRVTLVDFAVREVAPLRIKPNSQADQLSMSFGIDPTMMPVAIDPTMPVREICRAGDWSEVRVLQLPSDIGKAQGWVPTAMLLPVETTKSGRRVYRAADFEWPQGAARYEKQALTILNRIMTQNPRCDAFGRQAVLMEKDRAGPLFKVACFGAKEQVVDFRPDDATDNRNFAPVDPIDEASARNVCERAATERATHPSTINISTLGGEFNTYDDGGATYRTSFSAKNSFNLTLKYTIRCTFSGADLTNVEIGETAS